MSKPFWYDELCTVIVARQPGLLAIWKALAQGTDGQPPLFYALERAVSSMFTNAHVGFRVLSIAAFCLTISCVFVFVARRSGYGYGLLCACILFVTNLLEPYAVEARPYALLVGCLAFALVCYQRAPSRRWMLLMGMSFALAQAVHYYAILAMMPFGIAELAYLFQERKVRWSVWLACAFGASPLLIFWPLSQAIQARYGAHLWDPPSLLTALRSYGSFLNLLAVFGIIIAVVIVASVVRAQPLEVKQHTEEWSTSADAPHERVLILAFLLLPFIMLVAAKLAHGGFTERYALPTVLGITMAAGYVLPRLKPRFTIVVTSLVVIIFAYQEGYFWNAMRHELSRLQSPAPPVEALLASMPLPHLPIVVSNVQDYLQLAYYSTPEWRKRFVYLVDTAAAIKYTGSDADLQVLLLGQYYPLQVAFFRSFLKQHPSFLLYSGHESWLNWWPARLAHDGFGLQLVVNRGESRIYLVTQSAVEH